MSQPAPNYDVVTIRMNRSELHLPWGFIIQPPCIVRNVEGGSLADKAGLQNGDLVDELQFERNPSFERLNDLMESAKHELNIIVLREPTMAARIWKPNVQFNSQEKHDFLANQNHQDFGMQHLNLNNNNNNGVRVSLQHQSLQDQMQQQKIHGFNQGARQFGSTPMAKIDPNAPSYMRSEALKMIQETENVQQVPPKQRTKIGQPPECFCCGRVVIGLMCNAFDKNLHPECFQCSTCGSPLAQQGHHFINDKFYCEVHGRQRSVQKTPPPPPKPTVNVPAHQNPQLKNPSRPFNVATNSYQNPENVVQPNNRFGQALVKQNLTQNNNNLPTIPPSKNQGVNFNRGKAPQKSPAFQRRRKLQKQWPPTRPNATQKNAQALRFWKFDFQAKNKQGSLEEREANKMKNLIKDFDSGKIAELDAKVIQETPRQYSKRLIATPQRLNSPMRLNPFAWSSNVELPSSNGSSRISSATPMSSSVTLDGISGNNSNGTSKSVTPRPRKENLKTTGKQANGKQANGKQATEKQINGKQANGRKEEKLDDETETSWRFMSQILEEKDILTESTLSSLKSSLSIDSLPNITKKSSFDSSTTPTPVPPQKSLQKMMSIQMSTPQVQITTKQSEKIENLKPKTRSKSQGHKIKVQKSMMKQESFGGTLKNQHKGKNENSSGDAKNIKNPEEENIKNPEVVGKDSLEEFLELEKAIIGDRPNNENDREEKIKQMKQLLAESLQGLSQEREIEEFAEFPNNESRLQIPQKTFPESSMHFSGPQKIHRLGQDLLTDKIYEGDLSTSPIPPQNSSNTFPRHNFQMKKRKNEAQENGFSTQDLLDSFSLQQSQVKNHNSQVLSQDPVLCNFPNNLNSQNIVPPNFLNKEIQQNIAPNNFPANPSLPATFLSLVKPLDDITILPSFIDFFPVHSTKLKSNEENPRKDRRFFDSYSQNNSIEHQSSLADLPPQMPELMAFPERHSISSQQSNKSLIDCFIKTGDFLSFLSQNKVLDEGRGYEKYEKTRNLLDEAEVFCDFQNDFHHQNHQNYQNQVPPQHQNQVHQNQNNNYPQANNHQNHQNNNNQLNHQNNNQNSYPQANNNHQNQVNNQIPPQSQQQQQRQHGQLYNAGQQVPRCEHCAKEISGSFVLATGKTWCPEHFTCANQACNRRLLDCGFVEEGGKKYCEKCFETLIAPSCAKCGLAITADCLNALQKQWHPECFVCVHCRQTFGNTAFYLENGQPYCEKDWNQLFTVKCVACKFPIEAGDRWIEAIGSSFHSNCFNCFSCQVNLEGQNFYARDGHAFCRAHA